MRCSTTSRATSAPARASRWARSRSTHRESRTARTRATVEEPSLDAKFTGELAAAVRHTFPPLFPTKAALGIDDANYPKSWQGEHFPGIKSGKIHLNGDALRHGPDGRVMPLRVDEGATG